MVTARNRPLLWVAIALCLGIIGYALYAQQIEASDTDVVSVPLDPADPARETLGRLRYLGGLDIPRMGQNIGGLSALDWDTQSGRLLALADDGRWVWITPEEQGGRLTGIAAIEQGPLLGLDGEALSDKEQADSEGLARWGAGPLAVSFERDHRVWLYAQGLTQAPSDTGLDLVALFAGLEDNRGVETFAVSAEHQLLCAERMATTANANCRMFKEGEGFVPFAAEPPQALVSRGAVPTDAKALTSGEFLILFRSYSPAQGNTAAIVSYAPDGTRRELMVLQAPLTLDNFEGLAVREGRDRTFLYIVSDDNFSSSQRTLLMKFELLPEQ